jgi:Ca2+-binding RTX toxin-like protein
MSMILGTNSNNILTGTSGSDVILAGNGNDMIDAGAGNDLVLAGNGNDLVIHRASENGGLDAYDGGNGQDTLRLIVSQALANSTAFQAEVAQFQWQINHYGSASGYFNTLDLLVTSFEKIQIVIDHANQPPTAVNDTASAGEDTAITIAAATLLGNDTDPDAGDTLTLISVQGAVNGSVAINGAGDVVFTPAASFSGPASFTYTIKDAAGATSTPTVAVAVAAVADTPTLSVANATGTENPAIALNIAAALTDTDGSETLTVEISGIPAGGTLNHGSLNGGVWTVAGADLATLTFTPPAGFSGPLNLSVVARSTESSNGSTAVSAAQTMTVIVPIIGTNGDDNIVGTANDDIIYALAGIDVVDAQGGNDKIYGGNDNDNIASGPGNDLIDGGAGLDRSIYTNAAVGITVSLAAGSVTIGTATDTLQSVEFIRGSALVDSYNAAGFTGTSTNAGSMGTFNEFEGMGGNDTITGNGNTRISYVNATAGVDVDLVSGTAVGNASVGTDAIAAGTVNAVRGSQFDDIIRGTGGNNTLEGQGGNDQLAGRAETTRSTAATVSTRSCTAFPPQQSLSIFPPASHPNRAAPTRSSASKACWVRTASTTR